MDKQSGKDIGKNTMKLIDELAADLKPVKVLPSPWMRWGLWALASFITVGFVMWMRKPFRPGFFQDLQQPQFLFEVSMGTLAALSCAIPAFLLSVPGRKVSLLQLVFAFAPLVTFVGMILWSVAGHPSLPVSMAGKRSFCEFEILLFSWIPILIMSFQLRKAYSFFQWRVALLMGVSCVAFPTIIMHMACMYSPSHILSAHLLPALAIAVVVVALKSYLVPKTVQHK